MNLVSHQKIITFILGCAFFPQAISAGESTKKHSSSFWKNLFTALPIIRTYHKERQGQLQLVAQQIKQQEAYANIDKLVEEMSLKRKGKEERRKVEAQAQNSATRQLQEQQLQGPPRQQFIRDFPDQWDRLKKPVILDPERDYYPESCSLSPQENSQNPPTIPVTAYGSASSCSLASSYAYSGYTKWPWRRKQQPRDDEQKG